MARGSGCDPVYPVTVTFGELACVGWASAVPRLGSAAPARRSAATGRAGRTALLKIVLS